MDYLSETANLYTQAAIGDHVHVPVNMIFQGVGDPDKAAGIFQFQADPKLIKKLVGGANINNHHVLWIGDAFFRSKIITASRHLQGTGIGGIYTTGFMHLDEWIEHGKILKGEIPPMQPRYAQ